MEFVLKTTTHVSSGFGMRPCWPVPSFEVERSTARPDPCRSSPQARPELPPRYSHAPSDPSNRKQPRRLRRRPDSLSPAVLGSHRSGAGLLICPSTPRTQHTKQSGVEFPGRRGVVTRPATSLVDQVECRCCQQTACLSIICHAMHPERKQSREPASPARASRVVDDRYLHRGTTSDIQSFHARAQGKARQITATREKVFHHEKNALADILPPVHHPLPPPSAGSAGLGTACPPSPPYQHTTT